jgi:hypothetical protein
MQNENKLIAFLVGIGALFGLVVTAKKLNSGNVFKRYLKFNKVAEGGLSRAKTDSASSYPCPYTYEGRTDWHTNKGITWKTFSGLAAKLGYEASAKNFFVMPKSLWLKILKGGYWHPFNLDNCKSPELAVLIVSWAWGSGVGGAEGRLARWQRKHLGIVDNDITPFEITENFNKSKVSNKKLFNMLCDQRALDFAAMNQPANLKGWLARLERFRKEFTPKLF